MTRAERICHAAPTRMLRLLLRWPAFWSAAWLEIWTRHNSAEMAVVVDNEWEMY